MSTQRNVYLGGYVGTGAALSIATPGFKPRMVKITNQTTYATAEWNEGMADATAITHDSGTDAKEAAQGITPTDVGFDLGTNAVINTSGNRYTFEAYP